MSEMKQERDQSIASQYHDRLIELAADCKKLRALYPYRNDGPFNLSPDSLLNMAIERGLAEIKNDLSSRMVRTSNNFLRANQVFQTSAMLIIQGKRTSHATREDAIHAFVPKLDLVLRLVPLKADKTVPGYDANITTYKAESLNGPQSEAEIRALSARMQAALPFDLEIAYPTPEVLAFLRHDCKLPCQPFPLWIFAEMVCTEIRESDSLYKDTEHMKLGIGYSVYHTLTQRYANLPVAMQVRLLEESESWDNFLAQIHKWRKNTSATGQISVAGITDDPVITRFQRSQTHHRFQFKIKRLEIAPSLINELDNVKVRFVYLPQA